MGTLTENAYVPDDAGTWAERARDYLRGRGLDLDFTRTHEEGWTATIGLLASDLDEGAALVAVRDPQRLYGGRLDAWAAERDLYRKAATQSRYTLRATSSDGTITYPAGSVIEGGGSTGRSRWTVVADTSAGTSETDVVFEAVDTGPSTALTGATTFRIVTPVDGLSTVTYDPADGGTFSVGVAREKDPALRARGRRSANPNSLRTKLLALDWVTAASTPRTSPGVLQVTVVPAPVGDDQLAELVDLVGDTLKGGVATYDTGADGSGTYTLDDGVSTDTIYYFAGSTESVAVVATVTPKAGFSQADIEADRDAAIDAVFAALDVGETLEYLAIFCAVAEVEGVATLALTLDGSASDASPSLSTNLLVKA